MSLARCVSGWIVLTALIFGLPAWSAVEVTQPYREVSTNGTAHIQCVVQPRLSYHQIQPSLTPGPPYPYPGPEELRVTLLKGLRDPRELCSSTLNLKEQTETHVEQEGVVECSAQARGGTVEVTMSGLRATDTDVYRCEIQVLYPPPYLLLTGSSTLVHVLDTDSSCRPEQEAQRQDEEEDDEGDEGTEPVSVPVVILLIMIVSVLVVIIYFQIVACERGRRETVGATPGEIHMQAV
ncbi:cytotoxic T-lymphocyte protein 4 isoform X1 [Brachyistius frenatus]|uniref:cytotoxic T-lymphocyte protein 4 isoform X1 n=1 Tax=Brachyistius frenatus TaxID=100188 RepID=UPI0037E91EF6